MKKTILFLLLSGVLLWLPTPGFSAGAEQPEAGQTENEQPVDPKERVLARVGDLSITQFEFEVQFKAQIGRMSERNRNMFMNPHGRKQFLDMLVDQKVWCSGAIEAGYDKDEEVVTLINMFREQLLVRKFYEKEIVAKAAPTETEIRKLYEANPDKFMSPLRVRVRHIVLSDSAEAKQVLAELKGGASFKKIAEEKSIDETTAEKGGDLGILIQGVALPAAAGAAPEFERTVFSIEPGKLSDVVKTHKGYHIIRVDERMEGELQSFESVRRRIEDGLVAERVAQLKSEIFEDFSKRFSVEYLIPDSSVSTGKKVVPPDVVVTPEKLFLAAMDSKDSRQRIAIYEELIRTFPDSKYASQAQFMIGFIYSEELKDYSKAEAAFKVVIDKYPESELVDSAGWMTENMRDESQEVGTVEDVKRKAKESSQSGRQ